MTEIRAALSGERVAMEAVEDELVEQERLYEQLAALQSERAALLSEVEERTALQRSALEDLQDVFFGFQDTPERLEDLQYELGRINETLVELQTAIEAERRLTLRLIGRVAGENDAITRLDTSLQSGVREQRDSQLTGLLTLEASLEEQRDRLVETRLRVVRLEAFIGDYPEIWRDVDSDERARVLARIRSDLEAAETRVRMRASRFESTGYLVALLYEHHRARMETVSEYVSLLRSLDADLATIGPTPTEEGLARAQAGITSRLGVFERIEGLLGVESPVASRLRARLTQYESRLDDRAASIERQREIVEELRQTSTVEGQQAVVDVLDREVARERKLLDDLGQSLAAQRRIVAQLYDVGHEEGNDPRILAYLRVRDRIADLLDAILVSEERLLAEEQSEARYKAKAVGRLRYALGVQDLWRRLPDVVDEEDADLVESTLLRDRYQDKRAAFELLSGLRMEANATYSSEVRLLENVSAALDRVETVEPDAGTPTTRRQVGTVATTSTTGTDLESDVVAFFLIFVLLVLWIASIVWILDVDWDRFT